MFVLLQVNIHTKGHENDNQKGRKKGRGKGNYIFLISEKKIFFRAVGKNLEIPGGTRIIGKFFGHAPFINHVYS